MDARIGYRPCEGIVSCYDVTLGQRAIGRVWKTTAAYWNARNASGMKAGEAFLSRALATQWVEVHQPKGAASRFAQRIAERRRAKLLNT